MGDYLNFLRFSRHFPFSIGLLGGRKRYGGRASSIAHVSHMTRGRAFTLSLVLSCKRAKNADGLNHSTLIMRYHG